MNPIILLGGAAVGLYLLTRPKTAAAAESSPLVDPRLRPSPYRGAQAVETPTLTPLPAGSPAFSNLQVSYVTAGDGVVYLVNTKDTGPSGRLVARATPGGATIGSFEHGQAISYVDGPDGTDKWIKVEGPDSETGETIQGWVAAQFLKEIETSWDEQVALNQPAGGSQYIDLDGYGV